MDLFGGKRTDKAQGSKRIKEVQQLIRDVAGNVDDESVDVTEVRDMMKAKQVKQAAEVSKTEPVQRPTPTVSPVPKAEPAPRTENVPVMAKAPPEVKVPQTTEPVKTENVPVMAKAPPEVKVPQTTEPVKVQPAAPPVRPTPPPVTRPVEPPRGPFERSVFCIYCGTRLPEDGSGCPRCSPRRNVPPVPPSGVPARPTPTQHPRPAPAPQAKERPTFCIYCGARLPADGSGCNRCFGQRWRRCQSCGAWVRATDITCPVCNRVLSIEPGRGQQYSRY